MSNSELLASFLQEAEEVISGLESGVTELSNSASQSTAGQGEALDALSILAHRMRGSAALYGYPQLSTLSGLLERLCDSRPDLSGEQAAQFVALLGTVVKVMRGGVAGLRAGQSDRDLGLTFTQVGGTQQLQDLVQAVPEAFRMRAPRHQHRPDDTEALETQEDSAPAQGLEGELRGFVLQNPDIWEYFAPEVQEHLESLRGQLSQPEQADTHSMFRAAHTIKGSSYMVGLAPLGDFAHRLEDLLGAVREDAVGLTPDVQHALASSLDLLDDMMAAAEGQNVALSERSEQLTGQLRALASGESQSPVAPAPSNTAALPAPDAAPLNTTIRVPAQRLEGLMEQVSELVSSRTRMGRLLAQMDDLQGSMLSSQQRFQRTVRDFEERYLNPDMVRGQEEAASGQGMGGAVAQQFAELEFDTYDDLNILSRSITELSADFAEVRRRLTDTVAELNEENETLGKLVRQLRVDVNQTSRVSFSQATARLRRWARENGEQFDLNIEGDDTLIESSVLQRIVDPLMHLLTNAVHHGLAHSEARAAAGKNVRGQVWVRAAEQNNFLEVTVADDGEGLNLERIKEKTLEKGLRSAHELNAMRESDLARLILLPGLSTEQAVGSVAGRGVGMDVVATTVRQLGGELLIQTEAGVGTAFTMRLPTTQRIMDVLEVQLAPQSWAAFPVGAIRALRDVSLSEIVETTAGPRVMFDGALVPVIDARQLWGADTTENGDLAHLALLSSMTGITAVRVMTFGRIEEVSVTPAGTLLSRLDYLSGLTIGASGRVLPILDAAGLTRLSRRPSAWLGQEEVAQRRSGGNKLLLVDDSLSVRRLVSRMLERDGYQVQTANDGQEALDILQLDNSYDAVITDLEMPRMNGYELLSAVRGRPESQQLPVLIMTTRAGEKHQRVAFQLGANDYFTKPVNEALLLRRLATLLGASTSLQEA